MSPPFFAGLPFDEDIRECPDRAITAALDATLVLAIRVLRAQHIGLANNCESGDDPLLMLNDSIQACAAGLHLMLVTYDDLLRRLSAADRDALSSPAPSDF